ncbi:MAG: phenol hydroxylase [Rhodanobacter sp.]|nr:MAG: phenol hydroxylase [Rhodanobacter sp.]TAM09341.1 MAG: phenol hydroxylase [Rhodanobacter sp.]TAM36982.1 MAG: phenol hydroxylase [Rhodanobacter sp.]
MNPSRQVVSGRQGTTVRVLGDIDRRFVRFEFSMDDPDLTVELVLSPEQFREFCTRHHSRFLSEPEANAADAERMKWRYGVPGTVR